MKNKISITLSYTWGILMNIAGLCAAAYLTAIGIQPERYHGRYVFKYKRNWGGVSLGNYIIVNEGVSQHTLKHEVGHSLQNAIWGPLFPFVIAIPSALRWHHRRKLVKSGTITARELEAKEPYDSIWFEGQATAWGEKFIEEIEEEI